MMKAAFGLSAAALFFGAAAFFTRFAAAFFAGFAATFFLGAAFFVAVFAMRSPLKDAFCVEGEYHDFALCTPLKW